MITGRESTETIHRVSFRFPLDAREMADAYWQVNKMVDGDNDDRFFVTGDDDELTFSWKESE